MPPCIAASDVSARLEKSDKKTNNGISKDAKLAGVSSPRSSIELLKFSPFINLPQKAKGKGKADSDADSVASMIIDVDIGGSEFDEEHAPKKPAARVRKTAAAPAKKAPARKGKKKAVCKKAILSIERC